MGHAITPSATRGMSPAGTLTKADEVLAVLTAGGRAQRRGNLWQLFGRDGVEIKAWQTAIKTADARHRAARARR